MWKIWIMLKNMFNNLNCKSKCSNCCTEKDIIIVDKSYDDNYLPKVKQA